jgi:hypothetical protein
VTLPYINLFRFKEVTILFYLRGGNCGLLSFLCGVNYLYNYFDDKKLTMAIRRPQFSYFFLPYLSGQGGIYEIVWQLFSATLHLHLPTGKRVKFYRNGKRLACRFRRYKSIYLKKISIQNATLIGQGSQKTQISNLQVFSSVLSKDDILSGQRKGKSQWVRARDHRACCKTYSARWQTDWLFNYGYLPVVRAKSKGLLFVALAIGAYYPFTRHPFSCPQERVCTRK